MGYIQLNSIRFRNCFYHKTGRGFPLILVHGFGEDSRIWKQQTDFLQDKFTVIVPDLPGSGKSLLPNETMSMELLSDFIHEVILQEKMELVILLGHSMGGYVSLAFARKYPDKLRAFGLIHSTAYIDNEEKIAQRRKSIRLIEMEGKEVFLKAMIPNLYSENSRKELKATIDQHLTMALNTSSKSLTAYYLAMILRREQTDVLKNTKLPVLFVIGSQDNAIPYMDMIAQGTLPERSVVEMLFASGHMGMMEEAGKMNAGIYNFCKYVLENKID